MEALTIQQQLARALQLPPNAVEVFATGGNTYRIMVLNESDEGAQRVRRYDVRWENGNFVWLYEGVNHCTEKKSSEKTVRQSTDVAQAAMTATLLEWHVKVGDRVQAGDGLYTLSAMKMQMRYDAPTDLTIGALLVQAGERVQQGQHLLDWT